MKRSATSLFKNVWVIFYYAALQMCLMCSPAFAQNSVSPGEIRTDATFHHIGVLWWIEGDDNLNSIFNIEYRLSSGDAWKSAAMPMRAHPDIIVDGETDNERLDLNYWAGSVMFLEPGTQCEIRLTLTDPDGGSATETITASTKTEQQPSLSGTHRYVIPGNGGGSGTQADPFQGLQTAADNASPGDIFHIASGTYAAFSITRSGTDGSPIVFTGPADKIAVVDGENTDYGVAIGDWEVTCGYIIIENLTIQNGWRGVDALDSHNITFRNNIVQDVEQGYINCFEDPVAHDQTISDNMFKGRNVWPGTGEGEEFRCIDLEGNNNIVCYNKISYFGDGAICTDTPPYRQSYSLDIYNNDVSYSILDLIEVDGTVANTRIWRNRIYNGGMGISLAPVMGGPCYVFRNEICNIDDSYENGSAYKLNRKASGLIVVHNTAVKLGNGIVAPNGWQNTCFRNNVLLSFEYVFELFGLVPGSIMDDWDYNAYGSKRPGTDNAREHWFKWNDVRYADLAALSAGAGIESHSVAVSFNDLVNAALPAVISDGQWTNDGVAPGSRDLTLKAGSPAIDAGKVLSNINDPFVTDDAPDCGAFEYGKTMPQYGPRDSATTAVWDAEEVGSGLPKGFKLGQNHPNPFNSVTTITYDLPEASNVTLTIYTIAGQKVATLVSGRQEAGDYQVTWDGSGFATGIYLYRLEAGSFSETRKALLLR